MGQPTVAFARIDASHAHMADGKPSSLRLILVPVLLTLAVSIVRLVGELQGWLTNESGGGGTLVGITWLVFVFGGWFGFRLSRLGSAPLLKPAWLWGLLPVLAFVGTFAWRMQGVDLKDTSAAAQEHIATTLQIACLVGGAGAIVTFATWPRLAWTLLLYGLGARIPVMAITWLAKDRGWNTHYTKLGPAGIEKDMAETLASTSLAQFGLWVPFTVLAGGLVGILVGGRRK